MYRFPKFPYMVDWHEKTYFSFLLIKKMAGVKKVVTIENYFFFMPVNHVKDLWISAHTNVLFL